MKHYLKRSTPTKGDTMTKDVTYEERAVLAEKAAETIKRLQLQQWISSPRREHFRLDRSEVESLVALLDVGDLSLKTPEDPRYVTTQQQPT